MSLVVSPSPILLTHAVLLAFRTDDQRQVTVLQHRLFARPDERTLLSGAAHRLILAVPNPRGRAEDIQLLRWSTGREAEEGEQEREEGEREDGKGRFEDRAVLTRVGAFARHNTKSLRGFFDDQPNQRSRSRSRSSSPVATDDIDVYDAVVLGNYAALQDYLRDFLPAAEPVRKAAEALYGRNFGFVACTIRPEFLAPSAGKRTHQIGYVHRPFPGSSPNELFLPTHYVQETDPVKCEWAHTIYTVGSCVDIFDFFPLHPDKEVFAMEISHRKIEELFSAASSASATTTTTTTTARNQEEGERRGPSSSGTVRLSDLHISPRSGFELFVSIVEGRKINRDLWANMGGRALSRIIQRQME